MSINYDRTTWVLGNVPAINAVNLNNIEEGILDAYEQININTKGIDQSRLMQLILTAGRYKNTLFDTPTAGDITEEIRLSSDDSLYATLVTEFDKPEVGDITTTLTCADLDINNKLVTEFNYDGSITETISEVT